MKPVVTALMLTLALAVAGCAAWLYSYEDPKIDLLDLQPLPQQGLNPGFRLTLQVTNPNDRPLPITGLYYEVAIEGHEIASGTFNEPMNLAAYGSQVITSDVQTSLLGSLNLVSDLIRRPRKQIDYELSAKVSVSGLTLPFRVKRSGTVQFKP